MKTWKDVGAIGLQAVVAAHREQADALWVNVHLPKTAGTTIGSQLMHLRQPSHNVFIEGKDVSLSGEERWNRAMAAFLEADRDVPRRFVTGHFRHSQLAMIRSARPDARPFTFLREPVERVISAYRYFTTERHPAHLAFRKTFPTLSDFIGSAGSSDVMTRHLVPPTITSLDAGLEWIDTNFCMVGIVEEMELSCTILGQMLGVAINPHKRANATARSAVEGIVATIEDRARIAEQNSRDVALYRHFRKRLATLDKVGLE